MESSSSSNTSLFSSFGSLQVTLKRGLDLFDGWPLAELAQSLYVRCIIINDAGENVYTFTTQSEMYFGSGDIDLCHQMYLFDNVRSTFTLEIDICSLRVWPVKPSTGLPPYSEVKVGELFIPLSRLGVDISVTSWHQIVSSVKDCSKAAIELEILYKQEGLMVHDMNRKKLSTVPPPLPSTAATPAHAPVDSSTTSPSPSTSPPPPPPSSSSSLKQDDGRIHILVADDSVVARKSLQKILESKGFCVSIASDGKEAFDMLSQNNPCKYDAAMIDIKMPIMDGFECVKACREMDFLQRLPIFLNSGEMGLGTRDVAVKAGATGFISKPIKLGDIEDLLSKYLSNTKSDMTNLARADFFSSRDDREIVNEKRKSLGKEEMAASPFTSLEESYGPEYAAFKERERQAAAEAHAKAVAAAGGVELPVPHTGTRESITDRKEATRIVVESYPEQKHISLLPVGIVDYIILIGPEEIPKVGDDEEKFKSFANHCDINVKIWDRFPRLDHSKTTPVPDMIEAFACPKRARFVTLPCSPDGIDATRPEVEFFSFVMAGDEEQYAACIRFYQLVHIDQDQRPRGASTENLLKSSIYNWWIEDEPEDEINTNTRLHYAELTMCMLTRGGAFLPQLSQLLFDVYKNDVLPALTLWESKAFPDAELWYTGDERRDENIPPMLISCTSKFTSLCLSAPAPIPGALHVSFKLKEPVQKFSSHIGCDHTAKPSRLILPHQIDITDQNRDIIISLPTAHSLPIPSHPVEVMFHYLGVRGVIDLLACVLCEKKILLHSFQPPKCPVIGEAIRSLIYPLKWTHVYVPIVPIDLLNLVEAPVPFILGVDSQLLLEDERNGGLSEEFLRNHDVVLVDCDSGVVSQAGGWGVTLSNGKYLSSSVSTKTSKHINVVEKESTHLPPLVDRWLVMACKAILRDNKYNSGSFGPWGSTSSAIQALFFDTIAMLLHRIDDCLFFLDSKTPVFNRPLFLSEYCSRENRAFLAALTDTNSFHLLTASMCSSKSQQYFKAVIRQLCIYESENSGFRIKKDDFDDHNVTIDSSMGQRFYHFYPEWLQNQDTLQASEVDVFIAEALKFRLSWYCDTILTGGGLVGGVGEMYGYKGEYLMTKDIKELSILSIPFETDTPPSMEHYEKIEKETNNDQSINMEPSSYPSSSSHDSSILATFKFHGGSTVAPGFIHDGEKSRHMYVDDLKKQLEGMDDNMLYFIHKSIDELHPTYHSHEMQEDSVPTIPPRFMGGNVIATDDFNEERTNSEKFHREEDASIHPDHGMVDPHHLVENIIRTQEEHEQMIDTIGRFLQYVFSSPKLEDRVLVDMISSLNDEMKFLSSRRRFLEMLSRAHPSSADKRLFPLRSIAFEALVNVFISFLNDCQVFKDFLSAQKLIGFAETFVRVDIEVSRHLESVDSDDATDNGENEFQDTVRVLNALVEGNSPMESICDKIKHHRIFHNLELWKVVLHSVEVMYKSGHTARYNSMAGSAVTVKLCRSVLVMMLSLEVNLDRAMAFIQVVSSDWRLEMNSYFDLQRFTSDLWKDTGDNAEYLQLYKKFGIELMSRLTDVVFSLKTDIGTTMEVLPASEDKSKILRILDLENFTSPEDLENIIPRSSSVLEVSVSDVIYHINNRSLSTDDREETSNMFSVSSILSKSMEGKNLNNRSTVGEADILSPDNPDRATSKRPFLAEPGLTIEKVSQQAAIEAKNGLIIDTTMNDDGNNNEGISKSIGDSSGGGDIFHTNNSHSQKQSDSGGTGSEFQFSEDGQAAFGGSGGHSSQHGDIDDSKPSLFDLLDGPLRGPDTSISKIGNLSASFDTRECGTDFGISAINAEDKENGAYNKVFGGLSVDTTPLIEDKDEVFVEVKLQRPDTVAVTSVACVANSAICTLVDGSLNIINMANGTSEFVPPRYNATSADQAVRVVPIEAPIGTNSVYAGVSFSGDVYKTSAAYAGIKFKGQGFLTATRDGSIGVWSLPVDPIREQKEVNARRRGEDDGNNSNKSSDSSWKIAHSHGNNCQVKSLLISTSTSPQNFSADGPTDKAHLFASNTSWQICAGDSRGSLSIHRGDGVLAAQPSAKSTSLSSKSGNNTMYQNLNSESVRSLQTQLLGVGGISGLCSIGCDHLRGLHPDNPGSVEELRSIPSNIAIGTTSGCLLLVDTSTGQPSYRVDGHKPAGISHIIAKGVHEIVSCGNDRVVKVWDVRTQHPVTTTSMSKAPMTCLALNGSIGDGNGVDNLIFAGSADGEVRMWDLRYDNVAPSLTFKGHTDRISSLLIPGIRERTMIVTSALDGTIRTWDSTRGVCTQIITPFGSNTGVASVCMSKLTALAASSPSMKFQADHEKRNSGDVYWIACRSTCGKAAVFVNKQTEGSTNE